jgi:hypothetical protein
VLVEGGLDSLQVLILLKRIFPGQPLWTLSGISKIDSIICYSSEKKDYRTTNGISEGRDFQRGGWNTEVEEVTCPLVSTTHISSSEVQIPFQGLQFVLAPYLVNR